MGLLESADMDSKSADISPNTQNFHFDQIDDVCEGVDESVSQQVDEAIQESAAILEFPSTVDISKYFMVCCNQMGYCNCPTSTSDKNSLHSINRLSKQRKTYY